MSTFAAMRWSRLSSLRSARALLVFALPACAMDPPAEDPVDDAGISPSDSTGTEGADGSDESDPSDATDEDDGPSCATVLCGESCCDAGLECVTGQCLPACDGGVRCGDAAETCCDADQVCLSASCETPGAACLDSFDCEMGEFCEPTLQRCLPQFEPVSCEIIPDFESLEVDLDWSFTQDQVISTPVVADLDGDGHPEVVATTTRTGGADWALGEIVVLDGRDGAEKLRIDHDPANDRYGSHGRASIGLTDVDGDDRPDIIYAARPDAQGRSLVVAVDAEGRLLWTSHIGATPVRLSVVNGGPSFANFDDDPASEIVIGATLIDDDGTVVWNEDGDGAVFGSNSTYTGGISAIVDLDGDGIPEIVSGRQAWRVRWNATVSVDLFWDAGGADGYPAIADFDLDGTPEVALVANGLVRLLDGSTGEPLCAIDPTGTTCDGDPSQRVEPFPLPGGGIGGPPTIADFDGDGRPEIAAAGGGSYSVYDLYREGEDVEGIASATSGQLFVRWSQPTQDLSSNATGSSVFDFQGDGVAEVVYGDECYLRVYSGLDGEVLLEIPSSSATIHEYPIVVDVDADHRSEIVVVSNDSGNGCDHVPDYQQRQGIFVYGDAFDKWVPTRKVWTSHTYHVTNATSAGNAPVQELDNWTQPGLNNYRQNVQGEGVFNAPDLDIELAVDFSGCGDGEAELLATVRNVGSLGVVAGIPVTLHRGLDQGGTVVGTQATEVPLLPGASTVLTWHVPAPWGTETTDYYVHVNATEAAEGAVVECDDSNNGATASTPNCPQPG